jgi:hypothetical protein
MPSRNDIKELLSGVAGFRFNKECLAPETNIYCCDVRLIDDTSPLLEGTKVILLMGARAYGGYCKQNLTLDEARGSPIEVNGIICIPTFSAQDAIDMKDFEGKYNDNIRAEESEEEDFTSDELDAGEIIASKGRGRTARSNYFFWLKADTKKALRILANDGKIPTLYEGKPNYYIAPSLEYICNKLSSTKNQHMFFDMETDFVSLDMRCFAFSFDNEPLNIYVVPTLTLDYKAYYGEEQLRLYEALVKSINNNVLVAHNGSGFDFFVLAYMYHIPINKVYDTMLAAHRCYISVEKSLGHQVSLHTYEPYHKNEGAHGYHNLDQANQLYSYCGKDVFTMWLVWKGQMEMANKDKGLLASIEQANMAVRPYLICTLTGVRFDDKQRQEQIKECDRLMNHYLKIISTLVGDGVEPLISNKKCVKYFHEQMDYPVVMKTLKGKPSLKADALFKLALKVNTPVIKFLLKYRGVQKECGTLNFEPWINREQTTINV